MKRVLFLSAISLVLVCRGAIADDSAATAAAIAARQAADERYQRMAADIQALQADNESLKGKIASLEQKIDELRRQLTESANNSGVQEDLKRLAEKIEEVDKRRQEDRMAISEEIRSSIARLEKSLAATPASNHTSASKPIAETSAPSDGNGYVYTIQEGDTLSAIVKAYNADFKSKGLKPITQKQARDANSNVDWNRLRVGQKIVIPRPEN
jgi:TolA-binding protein